MTTALLGHYTLALTAVISALGIFLAICATRLNSAGMLRAARLAIYAVAGLLTTASMALLVAILDNDFRFAYVVEYTERALPLGYKLAAFWAGQEGSLLLWAWMVGVVSALTVRWGRGEGPATQSATLCILAVICASFAVILLYAANPFDVVTMVPDDGRGMNPLLQDPAMIAHPPLLFLGYALYTVPFAIMFGSLLAGVSDDLRVARTRQWSLAAWLSLTVGIILGAEWAYVELGWGGYWAWDPVENASLLPWLTGTALLHSLILLQRRGLFRIWSTSLAVLTFLLCIFGTFLTRSGIVQSVHAFGKSNIGWFFLTMLALVLAGSVAVMLLRRKLLRPPRRVERLISLAGAFLGGNVLLLIITGTTLVGTIYPLLSGIFGEQQTLNQDFYNRVVVPMSLALVALMGAGPLLSVMGSARMPTGRMLTLGVAAVAGAVLPWVLGARSVWMSIACAISALVAFGILDDLVRLLSRPWRNAQGYPAWGMARLLYANARRYGGLLAHLGVAMLVLGVAGSSLLSVKQQWSLTPGKPETMGSYQIEVEGLKEIEAANYIAVEAHVRLSTPGGEEVVLRPQKRQYKRPEKRSSEVAIHRTLTEDVYLVLNGSADGGRTIRIQAILNPLVNWIWIGAGLMSIGSLLCLVVGRRRGHSSSEVAAVEPARVAPTHQEIEE